MPSFKKHCADCREELGKDYDQVHRWLDEFAGIYMRRCDDGSRIVSMMHWLHRHHKTGVEEARKKWGDDAARAAELHILADVQGLGLDHVPSEAELAKTLGTAGP